MAPGAKAPATALVQPTLRPARLTLKEVAPRLGRHAAAEAPLNVLMAEEHKPLSPKN